MEGRGGVNLRDRFWLWPGLSHLPAAERDRVLTAALAKAARDWRNWPGPILCGLGAWACAALGLWLLKRLHPSLDTQLPAWVAVGIIPGPLGFWLGHCRVLRPYLLREIPGHCRGCGYDLTGNE